MNASDEQLLADLSKMESKRKTAIVFEQIKLDQINSTRNEIYQRNGMEYQPAEVDKENRTPQSTREPIPEINIIEIPKDRPNPSIQRFRQAQEIAIRIKNNNWKTPPIRPDQCKKCRATVRERDSHDCKIEKCSLGCACGFLAKNMASLNAHSFHCAKKNRDLATYVAQLDPLAI
ncbi:uncharacterized protein LOC108114643 [Drosophila eugracilis]|uniref:uncharacterized protein LOC108114643 n=1 Tax=Drosophila eugracilis TaxID=29029 RepID=UPI0007E7E25E|nr:uncharacterized protein LOC108114643 [Drosophila eugracilis]XP_017081203.1 uncharacterized protein LOC108114643 [Drosophila eugracilis]